MSKVTPTGAVISAQVRPNAQATQLQVRYGPGNSLNTTSDEVSVGDGSTSAEGRVKLDGLKPGKTFRYRVIATNDSGSSHSQTGEFTTAGLARARRGRRRGAERPGARQAPGRPLAAARGLRRRAPVGTSIDTRRGKIRLTTAARNGKKQTGSFGGGVMQVRQPRRARGRVDIYLRGADFARCGARRSGVGANASYVRRDPVRRLWGRDRGGRFRTFGRHSQATVRGTRWLTKDTCAGTLTVVTQGAVVVRDFARHRNGRREGGPPLPRAHARKRRAQAALAHERARRPSPANRRRRLAALAAWRWPPAPSGSRPASRARSPRWSARRSRPASTCAAQEAVDGLVVVGIDAKTFTDLDHNWPFPRAKHAGVVRALHTAGARAIVYDVQFTEPTKRAQDLALYDAIGDAGGAIMATSESDGHGHTRVLGGDGNLRAIQSRAAASDLRNDTSGAIASFPREVGGLESIAVAATERLTHRTPDPAGFRDGRAWIDYRGPPGTIPTVSFSDV